MQRRRNGFTLLEVLIVVAVIILLRVVSWAIYSNYHKNSNSSESTDVYANWRTYCSGTTNICFKYPGNWTRYKYPAKYQNIVTYESPKNTEVVSYEDSVTCTNNIELGASYTVSIEKLSDNPKFSVVGLIINNVPEYTLINSSDLNQYDLKLNKLVNGSINYCFSFNKGSWLQITPSNTKYALSYAKAWFSSQDAKTSLLIMKSVYLKS